MIQNSFNRILLWVTVFSVAMAYLESAVVVYLRAIAYPEGFTFPMVPLESNIAVTEIVREAATLIMLVGISAIVSRKFSLGFGYFIYCFAVWDIFYYVFLYLLLGWPETLLTWDVLFLIPVTWVGPVIAPVMLSLTMIFLFFSIRYFHIHTGISKILKYEWLLFVVGSFIVIISFTKEYMSHLLQYLSFQEIFINPNQETLMNIAFTYIPEKFPWVLFFLGELIIVSGIAWYILRSLKINKN
jgi:hypothetical protein